MLVDKLQVDEMSLEQISVDKLPVDKMSVNEMKSLQSRLNRQKKTSVDRVTKKLVKIKRRRGKETNVFVIDRLY